jgi:hypothetical protein
MYILFQCSRFKPLHLWDSMYIRHTSSISHTRLCGFQSVPLGSANTPWSYRVDYRLHSLLENSKAISRIDWIPSEELPPLR